MGGEAADDRLIVFAKYPEPGRVKTRLIPALGGEAAAEIHLAMTRRTLQTARQLTMATSARAEVWVAGGEGRDLSAVFGGAFAYRSQCGNGLGERLEQAIREAFRDDAKRVVVIGTDCPEITADLLAQALRELASVDAVLGPALDGGYYLIGLRSHRPELFRGIDWGTDTVLRQTLEAAAKSGLKVRKLRPLADVDRPEDLLAWRRIAGPDADALKTRPGVLSVIVPTLNEEATLAETLQTLSPEPGLETIVADGGSRDATLEIARSLGSRVVQTGRGRGRQMNAGAAVATGETLLFLHADTQLPPGFRSEIDSVLQRGCVAGAFRLRIRSDRGLLRIIERGANARSRLLQMPYGDQAIFLPARLFYQLGGYADLPLMEDFELCRRLRRVGRIGLAASAATTSPRRWNAIGIARTTAINQLCVLGYMLRVRPSRLARLYRRGS